MIVTILLAAALLFTAPPQQPTSQRPADTQSQATGAQPKPTPSVDETPVVTKHEISVGGRALKYTTTTGLMPIKNQTGETEAHIFFMAYTLDGVNNRAQRPLMFSFNGGPGSASVWLHMGALGPKRVKMLDDGMMPPAPYQLVDNEQTWLDQPISSSLIR